MLKLLMLVHGQVMADSYISTNILETVQD